MQAADAQFTGGELTGAGFPHRTRTPEVECPHQGPGRSHSFCFVICRRWTWTFVLMVYKLAVGTPNISYTSMVKAQRKEEEAGPAAFSPCIDRSLPEAPAANWPEQATRPPTLGRS